MSRHAAIACIIILHNPSGWLMSVETRQIALIQSIDEMKHHVAPGTNAIIYLAGKNIGVTETREQVETMMEECEE